MWGAWHKTSPQQIQECGGVLSVLLQEKEKEMFAGKKVSDRIVSIDRHYVRPIVRGKETKSVEFGAKVNNIQIPNKLLLYLIKQRLNAVLMVL